jgi:predicted RND superfamily exporter protein
LVAVAGSVITIASIVSLRGFDRSRIEYDFSKLRRSDTHVSGEAYWGHKMDDLLGRYLSPIVILTDGAEETRAVAEAAKKSAARPPYNELIASVQTIDDVLPQGQDAKIAELRAIKSELTPRIRASLPPDQRDQVDRYLSDDALRPIAAGELPTTFTAGLRERTGETNRAVLVYPRPSQATWQGEALMSLARELRAVAADHPNAQGSPARIAGSPLLSADIIQSIERDGPLATAAALLGVILLVAIVFRGGAATPLVIGSLVVGVLWLTAATIAFGIKINFANFIAFPITFGIGVDYAVNVMARYVQDAGDLDGSDGTADITGAIRSTGGAVGLCSLTTIIGYSSLLLAKNQALFLFGVVAVLGEIACLATAVLFLPAVLLLARRAAPVRTTEVQ